MTKHFFSAGLVFSFLMNSGCQRNQSATALPTPSVKIEKSIQVEQKNKILKIQKSALSKLFILSAAIKEATAFPTWQDLRPQIVMFERFDENLALFEIPSVSGATVIENKALLMTLKIESENDQEISFKWNDQIPLRLASNMESPEDGEEIQNAQNGVYSGLELISSLTTNSKLVNNALLIHQSARVRVQRLREKTDLEKRYSSGEAPIFEVMEKSVDVSYEIRPYQSNPKFTAVEPDFLNRVGFFLSSSGKSEFTDSLNVFITKWDISIESGPITFALSKHFPKDLVKPATEGLLYWNKVLGANVIRIVLDIDPNEPIPLRTVLVHWLPWQDAGAAWASLQSDPLTGEVLRGQIYLTSIFAEPQSSWSAEERPHFSLGSMKKAQVCYRKKTGLETLDKKTTEMFVADVIRHTVAHEAGHIMGLRHNFAASDAANVDLDQVKAAKVELLQNPMTAPGLAVGTSIMDYIGGLEEILLGRQIQKYPLSYDKLAMNFAYAKDSSEVLNGIEKAYCTDEDIDNAEMQGITLLGCARFDNPGNPLANGSEEFFRSRKRFIQREFEKILDFIYPAQSEKIENTQIAVARYFESRGQKSYFNAIKWRANEVIQNISETKTGDEVTKDSVYYLDWNRSWWNPVSDDQRTQNKLAKWMNEVGGGSELFRILVPMTASGGYDANFFSEQLENLKSKESFKRGKTFQGRVYQLNVEQQKLILEALEQSVKLSEQGVVDLVGLMKNINLEKEIHQATEKSAKTIQKIKQDIGQKTWIKETQNSAIKLMLSSGDLLTGMIHGKEVKLPVASFPKETREVLARLCLAKTWSAGGLGLSAMDFIKKIEKERLSLIYQALNLNPADWPQGSSQSHRQVLEKLKAQKLIEEPVFEWAIAEIDLIQKLESE